jgi:RNA polymerase sigma-70 factor (ECF subfamily)
MTDNNIPFKDKLVNAQQELVQYAHTLTSDVEEINDLVQETLLKALDNEDRFLPGTNLVGWACTIMKNIFINKCRKEIQNQSYINNEEAISKGHEDGNLSPDYSEYNYDIQEVYRLLNALSDAYKVPFMMYISGFKYREIAEKLNLPVSTIKNRIFYTRQKLLNVFND